MFMYAILLWALIELSAPAWCFVLLAISALSRAIKWLLD